MDNAQEPKPSIDDRIDAMLNPAPTGGEQQEASSPQTEQPEVKVEGGSDPTKTQGTPEQPETDKGFASHPKWIERETKLKEAREALQAKEAEASRYAKLLDELQKRQQTQPDNRQTQQPQSKQARVQAIVQEVCASEGWNFASLNEEQKAIVLDQSILISGMIDKIVGPMLDQRLAPYSQMRESMESEKVVGQAKAYWADEAKKDGLEAPVVDAAINKLFADLDRNDPERKEKLSPREVYLMATRDLIREKEQSQVRQEARNAVKVNARPLGKTVGTKVNEGTGPKKKLDDTYFENLMESNGVKN